MQTPTAELVLERLVGAVQDVRDRLLRATAALDAASVPYAVIGGNAVAVWVGAWIALPCGTLRTLTS